MNNYQSFIQLTLSISSENKLFSQSTQNIKNGFNEQSSYDWRYETIPFMPKDMNANKR